MVWPGHLPGIAHATGQVVSVFSKRLFIIENDILGNFLHVAVISVVVPSLQHTRKEHKNNSSDYRRVLTLFLSMMASLLRSRLSSRVIVNRRCRADARLVFDNVVNENGALARQSLAVLTACA